MQISFGKTAYVAGTSSSILDNMENSALSITTNGEGMVIVTYYQVTEFIEEYEENFTDYLKICYKDLYTFLKEATQAIDEKNINKEPIGDIFFVS